MSNKVTTSATTSKKTKQKTTKPSTTSPNNNQKKRTRADKILEGMAIWAAFYRENPHRFAEEYLNLHLKLFQKILLVMMNYSDYFCYIAARG